MGKKGYIRETERNKKDKSLQALRTLSQMITPPPSPQRAESAIHGLSCRALLP